MKYSLSSILLPIKAHYSYEWAFKKLLHSKIFMQQVVLLTSKGADKFQQLSYILNDLRTWECDIKSVVTKLLCLTYAYSRIAYTFLKHYILLFFLVRQGEKMNEVSRFVGKNK